MFTGLIAKWTSVKPTIIMARRIGQDPDSRMRRRREWREAREKEWWEGDRREREIGEKQGGGERREDDMRERDGT